MKSEQAKEFNVFRENKKKKKMRMKSKKPTQQSEVLKYLKSGKEFNLIGTQRLGAIIFKLRKLGYTIIGNEATSLTRFGNSATYHNYQLMDTPEQQSLLETINRI